LLDEAKVEHAHEGLRWFGQVLGDVRDLDVLMESLEKQVADGEALLPIVESLRQRHTDCLQRLAEALSSEEYSELIGMLEAMTTDPGLRAKQGSRAEEELPALARRMWRRFHKEAEVLTADSPETEFHRSRILAKRTRYAAETVSEFVGSKLSKRLRLFAEDVESVQNVLGEHQDATYARGILLEFAPSYTVDGKVSFELGRVVERYDQMARQKRQEFFKLWRKLGRTKPPE